MYCVCGNDIIIFIKKFYYYTSSASTVIATVSCFSHAVPFFANRVPLPSLTHSLILLTAVKKASELQKKAARTSTVHFIILSIHSPSATDSSYSCTDQSSY